MIVNYVDLNTYLNDKLINAFKSGIVQTSLITTETAIKSNPDESIAVETTKLITGGNA